MLEGPGFSDGGEVGIGSGVEGVIRVSSRVIGLVKVIFLILILTLIFTLIFILIIIIITRRGRDGRGRFSGLPDGWRCWEARRVLRREIRM
jgi:hypothetical protein